MSYKEEFPGFELGDLKIPEGWEDDSWGNDACPSFRCGSLKVWVDHRDPGRREIAGSHRFSVGLLDEEGQVVSNSSLLETDDWDEVLRAVRAVNYCLNDEALTKLVMASLAVLPDLKLFCSRQGAGPDRRLERLQGALGLLDE